MLFTLLSLISLPTADVQNVVFFSVTLRKKKKTQSCFLNPQICLTSMRKITLGKQFWKLEDWLDVVCWAAQGFLLVVGGDNSTALLNLNKKKKKPSEDAHIKSLQHPCMLTGGWRGRLIGCQLPSVYLGAAVATHGADHHHHLHVRRC